MGQIENREPRRRRRAVTLGNCLFRAQEQKQMRYGFTAPYLKNLEPSGEYMMHEGHHYTVYTTHENDSHHDLAFALFSLQKYT